MRRPSHTTMNTPSHARPGLAIVSRATAAIAGGYALASASAVALAALWPGQRADAVLAGMQWSFVAYPLAAVWAFAPVPLRRVWAWLTGLSALCLALAWVGR